MDLYLSDAIRFVRSRMDELSFSNDDMIFPTDDDRNFDTTVEMLLPEAVETVVLAAPASLLEPENSEHVEEGDTSVQENGSVELNFDLSEGFLRLVAFKCDDSDIYVTHPVPFDGPEARMQANPYTRGTFDAPVLVERKAPGKVYYTYYSVKEGTPGYSIYKINKPSLSEEGSVFCPERLELAVLNRLTGMVLETYKESQHAQAFYQKSASFFA